MLLYIITVTDSVIASQTVGHFLIAPIIFRFFSRTLCSANGTAMVSVVCLSSVTFVHPTQKVKLFGNIFSPYGSQIILGLPASNIFTKLGRGRVTPYGGAKHRWGIKKFAIFYQ